MYQFLLNHNFFILITIIALAVIINYVIDFVDYVKGAKSNGKTN